MELKLKFTIVYDWLAQRTDLAWPEKIIIAHILRFDKNEFGCFKSNGKIAKSLGFTRVSVIRIINRLEDREWVIRRTYPNRERSLFVNKEKLDNMPLLAGIKGRAKPVRFAVSSSAEGSGAAPLSSSAAPPSGSGAAPLPFNRNRRQSLLRDIEETKEEDFSSSEIRERAKTTVAEFEDRKRKLLEQTNQLMEKP